MRLVVLSSQNIKVVEKMEKSKQSFITPIVVLVVICFVASAVLAGVFKITDPIIQTRAQEAANKAMTEVLPEGREFKEFEGTLESGVTAAYTTGNEAGTVCSTSFNGFGGAVKLMIGVNAALAMASAIQSGGAVTPEKSEHDRITDAVLKVIPGITGYSEVAVSADGQTTVYSDMDRTGYAMLTTAKGHHGDIKMIVGVDTAGKVTGVVNISSEETIGADALKDEAFLNQFVGWTAASAESAEGKVIDAVSGATDTSNAVRECVLTALTVFGGLSK